MNNLDLAYFAGFFDGDGHICIVKTTDQIRVTVTNTDFRILHDFQSKFGAHISPKRDRDGHENWKKAWRWEASSKIAKDFLIAVFPFLRLKRKQAKYAVIFQNLKSHHRTPLSDAEKEIRTKIWGLIRKR